MKTRKIVVKITLLSVSLLLGTSQMLSAARARVRNDAVAENFQVEPTKTGKSARAKSLFGEKCARCHGVDGRGRTTMGEIVEAPDFTEEEFWRKERREGQFVDSITQGKNQMPAFGKKLSKRDITTLAEYVRSFRKSAR